MKAIWSILLGLSLLGGCATLQPTLARDATVILQPKLIPSRLVQALVKPYQATDIERLDVLPYIEFSPGKFAPLSSFNGKPTSPADPGLIMASQASPSIDLAKPIKLTGLKPNQKYRIYARAYRSDGTLISTNDSVAALTVGNDDRPTMGTLPLKLVDVPFAGKAQVTLVHEGGRAYDRVETSLVQVLDGVEVPQATQSLSLGLPSLRFSNLHANTPYRLLAAVRNGDEVVATASVDLATAENDFLEATLSIRVPYRVSTLAGNGSPGFQNGSGASARFNNPSGLAIAPDGTLFVADTGNNLIRKVTPEGVVSTFAGGGFNQPIGIAIAPDGTLFVADRGNNAVRKVTPDGIVTLFASSASLNQPTGIARDRQGNLFVACNGNHTLLKMTSEGGISLVGGIGSPGYQDGAETLSQLDTPSGLAFDRQGDLFVADSSNCAIRRATFDSVPGAWILSTLAGAHPDKIRGFHDGTGPSAIFYHPFGLALDPWDNLFVCDTFNQAIRKVTPQGVVTTLAGASPIAVSGFADGIGPNARFSWPKGIAVAPDGSLYVADSDNHAIRKLR